MKKIAVALLASVLAASSAAADGSKLDKKAVLQQYELTQANKALVLKAYQELFGDHDLTALDRYWAVNYIQHNPTMTDGRDSVRQLLEKMGITHWPKQKVEFKRVIAEGDLVMTQVVQPKTDAMPETAIVDMFRVENGKIAEHWDVIQAVPADAVNKRSMY
ncbi:nuclear transport factor 2 family protein [Mesorhizobium sp. VK25A]|uniref:Nuclear transport factor 2 family protein n=1 Tax=Mesorhizobium vachelliae TaxID=3072309 RepID=A0ABU4ZZ97_9HYPH|nr:MULTISPECIES: nuclear transport factor 2 family protein [unclassified Mesorhizobium]MDX8530335.1 nuclear transport factor 2 family protein [Mesorhizobium sp. VK25D]MDX8542312.1 nuclear transport factor 2 family protein [Mesorhizobium sp. VK25A]